MYHTGGDRGWHHAHHQRDIPPHRNHHSRPYRGGYHEQRDHDNYASYQDNQCHERSFKESQYVNYSDHSYPEYYENQNQPFNEYREHREPVYNRGGRHDSGYHKETYYHGGYQRGRGEPARYRGNVPETAAHKKYCNKPVKTHKKENEIRLKTSTTPPVEKVIHNSGRTIVTLTPGITEDASETKSSKMNSPEHDAKPSQDCDKPSQETAKLACVKKDDVKVDRVVKEILTPPSEHTNEIIPACNIKTEITETKIEDTLQSVQSIKEEALPVKVNPGKRSHSEDRDVGVEQREGESIAGKRLCSSQDRDEHYLEKTVQIPFLGDMSSESASTSEQENTGTVVNCQLPDTAQELRTAFILARKEKIEVAFAQDCKTFAFVASTLLKKDPSIEAAVTSALRSSLQEMAGLCVQELNNFIDHYDSSE